MNKNKIVITGGPSTGKTSVIRYLEKKGFTCLHEVIRLMTLEKKAIEGETSFKSNPIVSVADPQAFNQRILNARIDQYKLVSSAPGKVIFFDRGIPDVLAYMDCFDQAYGSEFEEACNDHPYDQVFLMPPWKEIHISDNERFESFEESVLIHDCLLKRYARFGYEPKMVPKLPVIERGDFILDAINF